MASFYDDDGIWKPRRFWIGRGLYWLATVIAALMVVFIIGDLAISWGQGQPILRVFALLMALLVWLIGRACRSWGSPALTN